MTRQEVVCYPRDIHAGTNTSEQYAPAIVPGDRLYIKIGVSPPPGITITLHALPPQFLLAIAYIETLVTETFGCGTMGCPVNKLDRKNGGISDVERASPSSSDKLGCQFEGGLLLNDQSSSPSLWSLENIVITPLVFMHLIEFQCGFLWKTDIAALMKEHMFHLLAQTVRLLHYSECGSTSQLIKSSPRFSPVQALLNTLPKELKKLYECEMKSMPKMTTSAGTGIGLGVTDNGRFSTYFHALIEACLAISEMVPLEPAAPNIMTKESTEGNGEDNLSTVGSDIACGSSSGKRKRLKPKKERRRSSSSSEQRGVSESLDVPEASPSSSSSSHLSSQAEDQGQANSAQTVTPGSTPPRQGSGMLSVSTSSSSASSSASSTSSSSTSSSQSNPKSDEFAWFVQAVSISKILRFLTLKESQCDDSEVRNAIKSVTQTLCTPTAQSRLIIITGIPTYLDANFVKKSIHKVCNSLGGVDREEIFIPTPPDIESSQMSVTSGGTSGAEKALVASSSSQDQVHRTETADVVNNVVADIKPESPGVEADVDVPSQSDSVVVPPCYDSTQSDATANNLKDLAKTKLSKLTEGYAVISIPSKTKVELAKRAFLKTKWLNLAGLTEDEAESIDAPEESLNVHLVSQALLTEPEANNALESYLRYKLFEKAGSTISESTHLALTEIFYSCYFVDQQQQDSGDICLSKEQILNTAPENLLCIFFNSTRPSKKPLSEAVTSVLRQYGCMRHSDKDM